MSSIKDEIIKLRVIRMVSILAIIALVVIVAMTSEIVGEALGALVLYIFLERIVALRIKEAKRELELGYYKL